MEESDISGRMQIMEESNVVVHNPGEEDLDKKTWMLFHWIVKEVFAMYADRVMSCSSIG